MYFSGRVHSVIYKNDSQAFYILKILLDETEGDLVTVRGHVPGLPVDTGTWFGFEGTWITHRQYGRQITIQKAPLLKNGWDADTAAKMLAASGVGSRLVSQIRDHFGDKDFIGALQDPKRLEELVTPFSAQHVSTKWKSAKAHFGTITFLNDLALPTGKINSIWSEFGENAIEVLSENPWALVKLDGIDFSHADSIAHRLGLSLDSPNRVKGALLHTVKSQLGMGHLFIRSGSLTGKVRYLLPDIDKKVIATGLAGLHKEGDIVIDRGVRKGFTAIYDPWFHYIEVKCAELLMGRTGEGPVDLEYIESLISVGKATESIYQVLQQKVSGDGVEAVVETHGAKVVLSGLAAAAVNDWSEMSKIDLSENQKRGVLNALTEPISIITGLPGTGKTTSLRMLVKILQSTGTKFLLVAPTGIAAKRLNSVTGAQASTIHRALSAKNLGDGGERESVYEGIIGESASRNVGDKSGEVWGFSEGNPHPAHFIIVDESSMVDQALMYRLLSCTRPESHLVFVGDAAQLPSVGPGNVLRDLIASDCFPVVNLEEIYRQEDTSDIIYAAHSIYRDEVPVAEVKSDFSFREIASEERVLQEILKIAENFYTKRYNFQILSPRHTGTVGVTNLNYRLRELLNPKQPGVQEIKLGSGTIREDDRIMVIRNNYKLGVYNGDLGKVTRIDRKSKEVEIKIHGPPAMLVRIPFSSVSENLRLAYAMTVHKSQGQEYDRVVIPIVPSFSHQLQRNLLYTAITRAREKVVLVGSQISMAKAVHNNRESKRNTLFLERLQNKLGPDGVIGE